MLLAPPEKKNTKKQEGSREGGRPFSSQQRRGRDQGQSPRSSLWKEGSGVGEQCDKAVGALSCVMTPELLRIVKALRPRVTTIQCCGASQHRTYQFSKSLGGDTNCFQAVEKVSTAVQ